MITLEEMERAYKETTFDFYGEESTDTCTDFSEALDITEEHLVNLNFNYYELK